MFSLLACRLLFVGGVRRLVAMTLCVLGASGCDDGWHQGDPDEWAVTGWQLVPSTRDLRTGVALDPRRVSRTTDTVELVGPSLLVEGDVTVSTFEVGASRVVLGASTAWLLQTSESSWPWIAPTSAPRVPYVIGHRIDRDTLVTTDTVTWSPPLDRPVMIGDELLDLPGSGAADVARDVVVRLRDREGGATELLSARGYDIVSCVGETGVIVAVRLETAPAAAEVVSLRRDAAGTWVTERASFTDLRFDPSEVACDRDARRIALVTQSGVQVLDPATASVALAIAGGAAPMVLRDDGQALVAVRDRALIFVGAAGERATGLTSKATDPSRPVVTGDLAMFELAQSVALIDLVDGAVLHEIAALPGEDSMFPFQMAAWHPGNAVVIALSAYDSSTDYADQLRRLAIVGRDGVTELALPSALRDPSVHVSERALHVVVDTTKDVGDVVLATYDLPTAMPGSEILLPLCDSARVLERQGCR